MYFSYADPEEVKALIKGNVTSWREDMLRQTLHNVSARLSGRFPTLKVQWEESAEGSPLRDLTTAMVAEAARTRVANPDGLSSETMGPLAYSKFDSEDSAKGLFDKEDLKALEELLNMESRQKSGIRIVPTMLPAAPMPRRGKYTNSRRWKRY